MTITDLLWLLVLGLGAVLFVVMFVRFALWILEELLKEK